MNLFDISDNSDDDNIENYLKNIDDDNSLNINYLNNELSDNETEESINSNIFNNIDFININKYKKYNSDQSRSNQDTFKCDNEEDSLISSMDLGSIDNNVNEDSDNELDSLISSIDLGSIDCDNDDSDDEDSKSYNLMYYNMIKLELEKKIII